MLIDFSVYNTKKKCTGKGPFQKPLFKKDRYSLRSKADCSSAFLMVK